MLLRASSEYSREAVDLQAVTKGTAVDPGEVAHGEALVALAEAMVGEDDDALTHARAEVQRRLGPEGLVDAVAVASNFERMVRIADSTGIPLDPPLQMMSEDLREELHLDRFGAAANTPASSGAMRALGHVMRPALRGTLRVLGRGLPGRRS